MFWNKKPPVDETAIDTAMQDFHLALKKILENLHSTYLSDKSVLGETAIDSFIVTQIYGAITHSNLCKIENGEDIWNGCFARHGLFQAEQYKFDAGSPSGRDAASKFMGAWQVTIIQFTDFVENYSGQSALMDFLYENVYKPHNDEFSISTEAKEKFSQEYVPIFSKLITDINAAVD
jgi:hypothetical protein